MSWRGRIRCIGGDGPSPASGGQIGVVVERSDDVIGIECVDNVDRELSHLAHLR